MAQYRRLNIMEREELSRMLAAGNSLRATTQALQQSPEHSVARIHAPSDLAADLSGSPCPSAGAALGAPAAQTSEARGPAPLARRRVAVARAPLVA